MRVDTALGRKQRGTALSKRNALIKSPLPWREGVRGRGSELLIKTTALPLQRGKSVSMTFRPCVWFFDVNYETFNIIVISVFKEKLYNPHVSIGG
ncbi:MAG TPA: hypothetical protein ENI58_01590 [Nitrospirae bacterium]|nr:hypothetical protein [Nitrospirota bacterium]